VSSMLDRALIVVILYISDIYSYWFIGSLLLFDFRTSSLLSDPLSHSIILIANEWSQR
jgi:hypothetical protein